MASISIGNDSLQPSKWQVFYEKAWQARREFMQALIDSGERNPLRIIRKMEHHERFYFLNGQFSDNDNLNSLALKYNAAANTVAEGVRNVHFDPHNPRNMDIKDFEHLPGGMKAQTRYAYGEKHHFDFSYTEFNHMGFLVDFIRHKSIDAVVELGSGYSQNLFKFYHEGGPRVPYYGGEYTESGTECARMLARLSDEIQLTNFVYDFNKPNYSAIGQHEHILVFTRHTIEQVEYLHEDTLASIAAIAPRVTCVHFEPFGYQIPLSRNAVDEQHKQLFFTNGWNKNLFLRLVQAHQKGQIDLQFIGKNAVGSTDDALNPTSLAVWESPRL